MVRWVCKGVLLKDIYVYGSAPNSAQYWMNFQFEILGLPSARAYPLLLTIDEVTDVAGLGKTTIYEYIKQGIFPKPLPYPLPEGVRGRRSRWLTVDVLTWVANLAKHQQTPIVNPNDQPFHDLARPLVKAEQADTEAPPIPIASPRAATYSIKLRRRAKPAN